MTEVEGVEYCRIHGGLIIEGETDDECQYGYVESSAKCLGVALFAAGYPTATAAEDVEALRKSWVEANDAYVTAVDAYDVAAWAVVEAAYESFYAARKALKEATE
jgi:hypothetical protein